ncbi:MAG: aldehyde ferredoxin oxidoreductase N-terminal domain-containing protein [Dehalococcoidia bacterium]|jgi:aldehyde:ferredoxin oxidoreductase
MHGWMGKILHVDLTGNKTSEIPTQLYAEKYLGGRGIASRLYWEKVTPDVKAFDPDNRLIFMSGPLLATGVQGAARMCVTAKSPMTYPEGYCYGSLGGYFPSDMKRAGWDGIIIDGRAENPVCLVINNDRVEIKDATHLWGKSAYQVEEMLRQEYGEKVRFVTTGVAGENLVRTAIIFASQLGAVTAGFGAVMASKNLKAIALQGTGHPTVADPDRLKELNRYTIKIKNTVSLEITPRIGGTEHGHVLKALGKRHCYQCGLTCSKYIYRFGNDPELEELRGCQAMEYYLPWIYGHEDEPVKTLFDAPTLANDYSIGTFELQHMVEWLYACYKSGVLTEEETGLPLSEIGTREFLDTLLYKIAHREGFGDILAEGMMRVRGLVKPEAAAKFTHHVAPIGQHDGVPPRAYLAHALLYPFETRMHPISVHELGYVNMPWAMHQSDPESSPVTPESLLKIARLFWGGEAAADFTSYEGKAMQARNIQNRTYLRDCLGLCDFVWPITYSLVTEDGVGDPELEGMIFTAVTGLPVKELDTYAERVFNMQRLIRVREGHRVPEDDYPPDVNFTEPIGTNIHGMKMIMPGPGAQPVDITGNILDRDKFTTMLKEYYEIRGWDKDTGLPARETLASLGMEDLAAVI